MFSTNIIDMTIQALKAAKKYKRTVEIQIPEMLGQHVKCNYKLNAFICKYFSTFFN